MAGAGRHRGGPGHRDQGDVGHRAAGVAGRVRAGVVVAGTARPAAALSGGRWRKAVLIGVGAARGRRRALLLVVPDASRGHPGSAARRAHLRRARGRSGRPRAPVALLPRHPRLVVVGRPDGGPRGWCSRWPPSAPRWRGSGAIRRRARGGVLAPLPDRQRRPVAGDLLRHPLQDALEPAALLRRDHRRGRPRRRGAGAGDGLASGPRPDGGLARGRRRPPGLAGVAGVGRATRPTRATRMSMRRRSRTRCAWRHGSATWRPCTPTATHVFGGGHAEQWPLPW